MLDNLVLKKHISIVLITSRPDLINNFSRIAKQEDINYSVVFAGFDEAGSEAEKLGTTADAILSLIGTDEQIRKVVDIPVITIPYTSFDVMHTIYSIENIPAKIALITYKKMHGVKDIQKMVGITIFEYRYESQQDLSEIIEEIKRRNIEFVIAGMKVVDFAIKNGLKGILRYCGDEAIRHSIHEAIHLARVRRKERNLAARIKVVFDSLAEGVIVTDEKNTVVVYNPAAEKILKISQHQVIDQDIQTVLPNIKIDRVFKNGQPELNDLQEINGVHIASNRIPVLLDGTRIGVVTTFENVTKIQQLEELIRNKNHTKGFIAKNKFDHILSSDPHVQELKELAKLYATTDSSVIIHGESGTGKELFAQSIHNASKRVNGPFVAVNCAALPETLLESELFGYEGGSFTGARKDGKPGLFELAHNGTIFLDEIGEMPNSLQARLLRVLQEKEIMRIGGNKIIPVNIRIISATNVNLARKVEQGEFRKDLYYRLNVFNIELPPLRDRKQDIILLAADFLKERGIYVNEKYSKELKLLLIHYDWPGNIRELYNIVERLSLLIINAPPEENWDNMLKKVMRVPSSYEEEVNIKVKSEEALKTAVHTFENKYITLLLTRYEHDYEKVAQKLGISRTTLWRKIK
ncbi:MAG: sigma 54-interacting transcriptional regulator [Veillonellales bacterium]